MNSFFNPSTMQGALFIGIIASIIASIILLFFAKKNSTGMVQKGKNIGGDMNQNSKVIKKGGK